MQKTSLHLIMYAKKQETPLEKTCGPNNCEREPDRPPIRPTKASQRMTGESTWQATRNRPRHTRRSTCTDTNELRELELSWEDTAAAAADDRQ